MAEGRVLLKMEDVSKIFGVGGSTVTALNSVEFEARAGEVVVIMGPSGAGKTTFLTIAGALLRPTSGTIKIADKEITSLEEKHLPAVRRENVGFIFQSFNLLESLNAIENVGLVIAGGMTTPRSAAIRARELLNMLGLGHRLKSLPKQLSGGEKQRVAIARALMSNPELILADEPTGNLDYKRGQEVMQLLRQIAVELEKAVVIVSHDYRVREVAHRALWLQDGQFRAAPVTVRDPVCGQLVEVDAALSTSFNDAPYFFCAEQCFKLFEADPQKYVGSAST